MGKPLIILYTMRNVTRIHISLGFYQNPSSSAAQRFNIPIACATLIVLILLDRESIRLAKRAKCLFLAPFLQHHEF